MADPNRPDNEDMEGEENGQRTTLDQEIARKYDPQALARLVVRDAGRGEPMDLDTRRKMEKRLGGDFGSVRVFRGPLAEEITRRYRADAVTVGGTEMILVREGARGGLHSPTGQALLAHELTHVQQQRRGLQFAQHEGGSAAEHDEGEREAEQVEAMVHGEETQGPPRFDANTPAGRMLMNAVEHRVKQMIDEARAKGQMRSSG